MGLQVCFGLKKWREGASRANNLPLWRLSSHGPPDGWQSPLVRKIKRIRSCRHQTFLPTHELTSLIIAPFVTLITEVGRLKSARISIPKYRTCACLRPRTSRTERSTTSSTMAFGSPECPHG